MISWVRIRLWIAPICRGHNQFTNTRPSTQISSSNHGSTFPFIQLHSSPFYLWRSLRSHKVYKCKNVVVVVVVLSSPLLLLLHFTNTVPGGAYLEF